MMLISIIQVFNISIIGIFNISIIYIFKVFNIIRTVTFNFNELVFASKQSLKTYFAIALLPSTLYHALHQFWINTKPSKTPIIDGETRSLTDEGEGGGVGPDSPGAQTWSTF